MNSEMKKEGSQNELYTRLQQPQMLVQSSYSCNHEGPTSSQPDIISAQIFWLKT